MEEMLGRLESFSIAEEENEVIGISDKVLAAGRRSSQFGKGKSYHADFHGSS